MVLSMTGYGRGTSSSGDVAVTVEVRTLNHRYLEIAIRLSSNYYFMEPLIRDAVREYISRGKTDVTVTVKDNRERPKDLTINESLLRGYLAVERELKDKFGLTGSLGVEKALSINGVVSVEEVEPEQDPVAELVLSSLKEAMAGVCQMRRREGKSIEKHLRSGTKTLKSINGKIGKLSEGNKKIMGDKLKERIAECLEQPGTSIDSLEERLAVEIAVLADKLDVSEEVERIGSHLEQFQQNLRVKTGSVGRKLDFIIQELNREFNTIGSKSQSAEIPALVIEAKAHLEKMREQAQNVE
jgi:uncharacterized protein (TIGR00255 family)